MLFPDGFAIETFMHEGFSSSRRSFYFIVLEYHSPAPILFHAMTKTPESSGERTEDDEDWKALLDSSVQPTIDESMTAVVRALAREKGMDVSELVDFEKEELGIIVFPLSYWNEEQHQLCPIWLQKALDSIKRDALDVLKYDLIEEYASLNEGDIIIGRQGIRIDLRRIIRATSSMIRDEHKRVEAYQSALEETSQRIREYMDEEHHDIEMWFQELVQPNLRLLAQRAADSTKLDKKLQQQLAQRYLVLLKIDSGTNGAVFLAEEMASGKLVAVKIVEFSASDHALYETEKFQFTQEMRIMASVQHPNVVSILDGALSERSGFYIMDWVDGNNALQQLYEEAGRMQLFGKHNQGVIDIMIDVLRGIAALHDEKLPDLRKKATPRSEEYQWPANGWNHEENGHPSAGLQKPFGGMEKVFDRCVRIHRDIKPGNVVLNGFKAQLCDFGIAIFHNEEFLSRTQRIALDGIRKKLDEDTQMDQIFHCTPHYAAPEYFKYGEVDDSYDIYSAGVMFYYLLTGHYPVSANSIELLVKKMIHGNYDIVPPGDYRKDLPAELNHLIMGRMLCRNPNKRLPAVRILQQLLKVRAQRQKRELEETRRVPRTDQIPRPDPEVILVEVGTRRDPLAVVGYTREEIRELYNEEEN